MTLKQQRRPESKQSDSSGFDALWPQHEDERLAPRLGRVGGFRVHPDDGARGVGAVFVPDLAFKDDVAFVGV